MVTYAFVALIAAATLVALKKWRAGVFWGIAVGMLQDPIRKLTPDAPAIMAVSSFPVWTAVLLRLRVVDRGAWSRLREDWPRVARRLTVFVFLLLPAALMAFQYGAGAWRLVVIGLLGYLAPFLAIVMGYAYTRKPEDLRALLAYYCVMSSVLMTGSILEYAHAAPGWRAVGTETLGTHWVRYAGGGVFDLISGFFRSPDVMGWHAATLVMLALTLTLSSRGGKALVWMPPAVLGAVCLIIAGRRKMVVMPAVWLAVVALANLRAGKHSRVILIAVIVALTGVGLQLAGREIAIGKSYYDYAGSVKDETTSRLVTGSWQDLWVTFAQSGVLGEGLGTASQGAQHVIQADERSWQESGLSKLLVELGVPGFLWALALASAVAGALLSSLDAGSTDPRTGLLVGIIAFCAANAASFVVSHQVYGDLLIMTLTAFFVGVALAGRRWLAPLSR
jgi:hypothetical protein